MTRRKENEVAWVLAKVVVLCIVSITLIGVGMKNLVLFSAVRGVVMQEGRPVDGAQIEQSWFWHWKDQRGANTVTTGVDGHFDLPAVLGRSLSAHMLPHEPFIEQTILIRHNGQVYEAWMTNKRDYGENDELNGQTISLFCDLAAQPSRKDRAGNPSQKGEIYGICELR